ncbi:MAG: GTPase, partial [Planctomycetota bacterium]
YGHWLRDGKPGEDVVAVAIEKNHVEVHCHGGVSSIKIIGQCLSTAGAIECDQAEFSRFHFGGQYWSAFYEKLSEIQTEKLAKILVHQIPIHQNFLQTLRELVNANNQLKLIEVLEIVLQSAEQHLACFRIREIAIFGEPNVGKSSLINALLGFDRAIVSSTAGTTRDVVNAVTAFDGWPVRLLDTAGIHSTDDEIEKAGVMLAQQAVQDADLTMLVVDPNTSEDSFQYFQQRLSPDLIVANKSDVGSVKFATVDLQTSAKLNRGIDALMHHLAKRLYSPMDQDSYIAFTRSQVEWLKNLRALASKNNWRQLIKNIDSI